MVIQKWLLFQNYRENCASIVKKFEETDSIIDVNNNAFFLQIIGRIIRDLRRTIDGS